MKEELEEVTKKMKDIARELDKLKENEAVQEYIKLQNQIINLQNEKNKLSIKKNEDYANCKHLCILHEDRFSLELNKGCIKCGLTLAILNRHHMFFNEEETIMYDYLVNNHLALGSSKNSNIICNLDLARSIYSRIKQAYPNIDDEEALKYLKCALHDIKNIEVSEERKINRARRLSLNPKCLDYSVTIPRK